MNSFRLKGKDLIFNLSLRKGSVSNETKFDRNIVNNSDIDENKKYYSRLMFVTPVRNNFDLSGRKNSCRCSEFSGHREWDHSNKGLCFRRPGMMEIITFNL